MNILRAYFSACLLLTILFIVSGCYKKEFSNLKLANAQPEYLYPLLDAQLNLKDIVDPDKKNLNIIVDPNGGFYTFIYYNDIFQQYVTDLLKIADLNINESEGLTAPEIAALPVSGSVTRTFTNSFVLTTTNGEQLKTLTLNNGSIPFNISSTFEHNIQLTITFPYITKNNVPLSQVIDINYNRSVPVVSNNTLNLAGYTIDLSQKNTTVNTISYTATMKVTYLAGNPINGTQQIDIATGLTGLQYSYADGYIGKYAITVPLDTVSIGIFNNTYVGNVFFTNPIVQAYIYNSIGAPSSLTIDSLIAISNSSVQASSTTATVITGSNINTAIPINFPTTSQQGQLIETLIQLDKTNSNVQTIFNPAPNKIIYKMTGVINPAGNTGSLDFVTDSSKINLVGEVQVPMQGYVKHLVLLDTIKGMTYPNTSVPGNSNVTVLKAGFAVNLQNGFPMNAVLQMYFLDSTSHIIDSLFSAGPQTIASGLIDNTTGQVTTPTNTFFKEIFTQQRYNNITSKSTTAVLYSFFNTANNGATSISIYPSYQIKANIGIDIQTNVTF